jgi:hypothetical protein
VRAAIQAFIEDGPQQGMSLSVILVVNLVFDFWGAIVSHLASILCERDEGALANDSHRHHDAYRADYSSIKRFSVGHTERTERGAITP